MTTINITGGDKLAAKLAELAAKVARAGTVRAGFLENATYPDGTSVATVAAIDNFGAPAKGIPARPFFTNMIKQNSPHWGDQLARLLKAADWNVERALEGMGAELANQIRQSIVDTNDPPNSPVTNLLKQRFPKGIYDFADVLMAWADVAQGETAPAGKPLVWSGHMLNSVDFEVG